MSGSPYFGASGGSGSPYFSSGGGVKLGPPKKKGGGILHSVEHVFGQGVEDLKNVAVNLPGGLYHTAGGLIHHPLGTVEAMGKGVAQDLRHPLRHPGYTALDLLGLADAGLGTVGRLAEVGRAARVGDLADVGKAALKGSKPQARVIKSPSTGARVETGTYSRAASTRTLQKGLDRLRARFPEAHIGFRNQFERVGHAIDTNTRFDEDLRRSVANELTGAGKRLRQPQKDAIRIVAEEVPLAQRIEHAKAMLTEPGLTAREQKNLQGYATRLKRAGEFVHDVNGVPSFKPEHQRLFHVFEKAKKVADKTERDLIESGQLTEKGAAERKAMVGEVVRGDLQARHGFSPDLVPQVFGNQNGFYVSYKHRAVPGSIERPPRLGSPQSIGIPRTPSELSHPFTGATLRKGEVNPDTTGVVAQHYLQTSRFLRIWHQRHALEKLAKDQPTTKYDIPIRPIWLKQGWPADVRAYMEQLDKPLQPEEEKTLVQKLHDSVFPQHPSEEELKTGGVKFIDKRELGRINRPGPLAGTSANPGFAKTLRTVDAINQAEKTATIYLRLGHIITRGANNLAFNLVQQGFLAPKNLARAARISTTLGDEAASRLDAVMGEGYIRSLGNVGPGQVVTGKIQRFYERYVDLPFRRASFLHEAAREGFHNADAVTRLLTEPSEHDTLLRVAQRASNEIIDYARLGPVERDLIRRIVFIYPWMKGATMYGGRFLGEHPLQSAAFGQIGKQQTGRSAQELGPLPSYLQGIFKVGGGTETPTIVNPRVINQFGTPADVLEAAAGALSGHPKKAYQLREFLMPAYQAAAGENATGTAPHGLEGFLRGLYNSTPEYTLAQRLLHPPERAAKPRIYPYSRREALLQFFGGSASPHKLNRGKANAAASKEAHPNR